MDSSEKVAEESVLRADPSGESRLRSERPLVCGWSCCDCVAGGELSPCSAL